PIATEEIDQKNAIRFSLALGITGLLLSTWFGLMIFIYQLTLTGLSYLYSAPPLRLKSRYPFDILSHGFFFGALILLFPVIVFGPITNAVLLLTVSVFFLSILIELWNHISDYESDMKAMLKTTVCVLGLERSVKIAMVLSLLFPVTLFPFYYGNGYLFLFIFATTVYSLLFYWKRSPTYLFSYANLLYGHLVLLVALPFLI
ncbi:MAG: UbiA family prenyltransferase, partial [Candidatus Thorarchaeota archaeon]